VRALLTLVFALLVGAPAWAADAVPAAQGIQRREQLVVVMEVNMA
jgi:hypothetical protein